MKPASLVLWLVGPVVSSILVDAAPGACNSTRDPAQEAATKQVAKLQREYNKSMMQLLADRHHRGCTARNVVVRREWGSMSKRARRDYIEAVQCLQKKPARGRDAGIPGARSRFDDFAGMHIQQTPFVHFSGLFLPFHRYLVHLYEKALRDECGYQGTQPYWDWTLSWRDPRRSTVFDGSPYSMGGNGKAIPHGPTNISAFGISLTIQPGTGGGCVESGPFAGVEVHLGPVAFEPRGPLGGLGYNPRCLVRDISPAWANYTRPTDVAALLLGSGCGGDVGCFRERLEALDGVHAAGHFTIGGLNIDAFSASGDPAFFLHHAMVDRMWALWQAQDPAGRTNVTAGTGTAFNQPPSANVTLETLIDVGLLAAKERVGNVVSTIDGDLCYVYA